MRGPLRRVAHNGGCVGFEVTDIAVSGSHLHKWTRVGGIVLQVHRGIVLPAVVGPRDARIVESVADSANVCRWNRSATRDTGRVNRPVRKEAGIVVVHHVIMPRFAVRLRIVWEGFEVPPD